MYRMTSIRFILIALGLTLLTTEVSARPIYVYKEGDGVTRFSSKKPPKGVQAKVFTARNSKFSWYRSRSGAYAPGRKLFRKKYSSYVRRASQAFGVNENLIRAVIHAESAFNPKAVSNKGALGLMQLMPVNLRPYGVKDPFSPQQNIQGGTKLLSKLVRKYGGNVRLALAAYNAGEGAVKKYGGIPPYAETQKYVRKVIDLQRKYSKNSHG